MKAILIAIFLAIPTAVAMHIDVNEDQLKEVELSALGDAKTTYMPQSYDVSRQLVKESKCCFFTGRWLLQPINVVAPLISSILIGFSEYYINSKPETAQLLNGLGLGFAVIDFISGVWLVKITDRVQEIDHYVLDRQGSKIEEK